jgi:hypothetical protein
MPTAVIADGFKALARHLHEQARQNFEAAAALNRPRIYPDCC